MRIKLSDFFPRPENTDVAATGGKTLRSCDQADIQFFDSHNTDNTSIIIQLTTQDPKVQRRQPLTTIPEQYFHWMVAVLHQFQDRHSEMRWPREQPYRTPSAT